MLEQSLFEVQNNNNGLAQENTRLHKRCDDQELYSRRENLAISGVAEAENEDDGACKQIAGDIFVQNHGLISNVDAGSIILEYTKHKVISLIPFPCEHGQAILLHIKLTKDKLMIFHREQKHVHNTNIVFNGMHIESVDRLIQFSWYNSY